MSSWFLGIPVDFGVKYLKIFQVVFSSLSHEMLHLCITTLLFSMPKYAHFNSFLAGREILQKTLVG